MTTPIKPPYIHSMQNTTYINLLMIISLIPVVVSAVFSYGVRALVLVLFSFITFMLFDSLFEYILKRDSIENEYYDSKTAFEGIVFALLLPPQTSIIVVAIGALFATLFVKHFFGGRGNTLFNQAAAARLFVGIVFKNLVQGFDYPHSNWLDISSLFNLITPFSHRNTDFKQIYFLEILTGNFESFIGTACFFAICLGAIYLLLKKTIKLYITLFYILSSIIFFVIFNTDKVIDGNFLREIFVFLFSSGLLFVVTYMLNIYSNVPNGFRSSIIMSILYGACVGFLYNKADMDIVICVPVLFVNLITPILEYFVPHQHIKKGKGVKLSKGDML